MTEVRININERDMDAIEDVFFCELPQEEYEEIRPLLLDVWRQLCEGMEKETLLVKWDTN